MPRISAFILEMFYQIHDVCLNLMNEFNLILYSFVNRRKPDKQDKVFWAQNDHHSKIRKLFDVTMHFENLSGHMSALGKP